MKKLIIGLVLIHTASRATHDKWADHTYRNMTDYPVEIITEYTQVVQQIVQPKKRIKVRSKQLANSVKNTLNPHEFKTIILTGDPLSSRRVIPGSIRVFDGENHDQAILPKYNVQNRDTFIICRNSKGKLEIHAER